MASFVSADVAVSPQPPPPPKQIQCAAAVASLKRHAADTAQATVGDATGASKRRRS